jgi:hypothetical protein
VAVGADVRERALVRQALGVGRASSAPLPGAHQGSSIARKPGRGALIGADTRQAIGSLWGERRTDVKRYLLALCVAVLVGAAPAFADAGPPGTTFPEQPGSHVQGGCNGVTSNPGTGPGGSGMQNMSPTAGQITGGLLADACFGG